MGFIRRAPGAGAMFLIIAFAALASGAATAETEGSSGDLLDPPGFEAPAGSDEPSAGEPEVEVGKVTSIPPSEALGEGQAARSLSAATACNQQKVIANYPELRFTGIKKWCYDGTRVISGGMTVEPHIKPEHRYTNNRDGWVYIPKALEKTDRFVKVDGVAGARHESTRTGRFEYKVHGQSKPQVVYVPFLSRTAYGDGDCRGPKPKDLAPRIVSVAPSPGQEGFARGGNIVAKLNMEAKEGTSNIGTFYAINNKTGEYVEGTTGRYTPDLSMIIIIPEEDLDPNTKYTATVSAGPYGVLGKTGDPLWNGKTWIFTTGAK